MNEHKVTFGTLHEDGTLTNIRLINLSDIDKCPFLIMLPEHFREDGSCKCNDEAHQKMMIKEWGYKKSDFIKAGLISKSRRKLCHIV